MAITKKKRTAANAGLPPDANTDNAPCCWVCLEEGCDKAAGDHWCEIARVVEAPALFICPALSKMPRVKPTDLLSVWTENFILLLSLPKPLNFVHW